MRRSGRTKPRLSRVTDIPVGSPPVPPGRHAAPGGWYADPLDSRRERYWDGWQWSRTTRELDLPAGVPPRPSGYGQPGTADGPPAGPPPPSPYGQNPYAPNPYGQHGYGQHASGPGGYPTGYPLNVPGQQAVATADGVRLAGWWIRVLAVLLDGVIVSLLAAIPNFGVYTAMSQKLAAYFTEGMRAAQGGQSTTPLAITDLLSTSDQLRLTLVSLLVALVYNVAFVRLKGATPGKLICGLRIVPVDAGRFSGQLPWSTVLIRVGIWVLPKLQGYLVLLQLLDSLFPLWHPKRQALHDLAAKTQVIRKS